MLRKFRLSVNDNMDKEDMAYQKIINFNDAEDDHDPMLKFNAIVGHHRPLLPGYPNYNGSQRPLGECQGDL
jgi:hypothetical protein